MAENKGKPSGTIAKNKKDVGKHGDVKRIGRIAGARKKKTSGAGTRGVAGTVSQK